MLPLPPELASLLNPLSLAEFVATLPAKIEKDELRLRLFGAAVANKTAEMTLALAANATAAAGTAPIALEVDGVSLAVTADLLKGFRSDVTDVLAEYEQDAERLAPKKWSLGALFGHADPFAPGRERVRAFAAKWNLDPTFRDAMG